MKEIVVKWNREYFDGKLSLACLEELDKTDDKNRELVELIDTWFYYFHAALHHQIYQCTDQVITLGPESLSFALVGYPLITKYLEHLPDLLKHLAKPAPALFRRSLRSVYVHWNMLLYWSR